MLIRKRHLSASVILLMLAGVQTQPRVTLSSPSLCVVTGSTVKIPCTFTKPYDSSVTQTQWYRVQSSEGEPQDLSNDPQYSGRVSVSTWWSNCDLTVKNVRVSDSGVYNFRFKTQRSDWTSASCGVQLTVTGGNNNKKCWSVTYISQTICSLIGSSVDLHSYYSFPNHHKVTKVFWFNNDDDDADVEPVDVIQDKEYQGRVQYTDCRLRITNLRERDAQTYRFRFYTNDPSGKYTGQPGVTLSVTDLKVTVSEMNSWEKNLSCFTTCTLSNSPTYIWYKNGQRVPDCNSASCSVPVVSGVDSYSCAVEGHDSLVSPPVYSPKNTRAVVLLSEDTVEGDSVTLSCSSDANPPAFTFTWFKQTAAADTLLTTGQNYSISNISTNHSGLYYCTAHNQLGQDNSTLTHLDVLYPPRNLSVIVVPSISGDLVTLKCTSDSNPSSSYTWYKKTERDVIRVGNGTNLTLSSEEDGLYYCTAMNRFGSSNSSEWTYTSDNRIVKYAASGFTVALVLLFIGIFLWMRYFKRRPSAVSIRSEEVSRNDSAPVYSNTSAMTSDPTQTASSEDQDSIGYTKVYFRQSHTEELHLYSTVQLTKALNQEEGVEYATVSLVNPRAVREDEIYSNLKSKE